jgi:DNA-binding NarL/FixJ family response regulator
MLDKDTITKRQFGEQRFPNDNTNTPRAPDQVMPSAIHIAWVDHCQLTRECMTAALSQGTSPIFATPYEYVSDLIAHSAEAKIDLVVLHAHSLSEQLPRDIATLRRAGLQQPIVLVTQDDEADQVAVVKHALRLGASGHLSSRSTGIEMAISSFAFAHEGGTFASMGLLLSEEPRAQKPASSRTSASRSRGQSGRATVTGADASAEGSPTDAETPVGKTRRGRDISKVRKSTAGLASTSIIGGDHHE